MPEYNSSVGGKWFIVADDDAWVFWKEGDKNAIGTASTYDNAIKAIEDYES